MIDMFKICFILFIVAPFVYAVFLLRAIISTDYDIINAADEIIIYMLKNI